MLKNALFYELDPDETYCLLEGGLIPFQILTTVQKYVLRMIRENFVQQLKDRQMYIQMWALRIVTRLENWFSEDELVCVYCRPNVCFPTLFVCMDEDNEHPFVSKLQKFKKLLTV